MVKSIQAGKCIDEDRREAGAVCVVERHQVSPMLCGSDLYRDRVCGRVWHPCGPQVIGDDQPFRQIAFGTPTTGKATRLPVGNMVIRVDLTVRVSDGRADLTPAIFEWQDVLDVRPPSQPGGSFGPEIDNAVYTLHAERPERGIVIARVQNDLAPLIRHCRPPILKPFHIVRLRGLQAADAKRAASRREIRPGLSAADDVDNCPQHRVNS